MENRTFAQATAKLFGIATFSPAALSAPAFAGLARFSGSLGRVPYAGDEHTIVCRRDGGAAMPPSAAALCAWHDGTLSIVRTGRATREGDVVLYALAQSAHDPAAFPGPREDDGVASRRRTLSSKEASSEAHVERAHERVDDERGERERKRAPQQEPVLSQELFHLAHVILAARMAEPSLTAQSDVAGGGTTRQPPPTGRSRA